MLIFFLSVSKTVLHIISAFHLLFLMSNGVMLADQRVGRNTSS